MSNISQFGGGGIKSIQTGLATPSTTFGATSTVTISSVDTTKAICFVSAQSGRATDGTGYSYGVLPSCALTSATQLTVTQGNGAGTLINNGSVRWTVVEYY